MRRIWRAALAGIGVPRRDRAVGSYEAFVPDRLVKLRVDLESDVTADATDAEVALARFDAGAQTLTNSEALARLLLRAESVASSYIEGLTASPGRVLRADAARGAGIAVGDRTAHEILANIDALAYAVEASGDITVDRLLEVHRRLLGSTPLQEHAGIVRDRQNWIGGSAYTPIGARFVPPPPEYVGDLLADLCTFCNDDALPAVVQAALAHAQFEAIHPFADGNGRTGRALTYMVLRRRGLAMRATPPISLVLATQSAAYVALLNATCVSGSPTSAAARAGRNRWIAFFAAACSRAVAQAEDFEARVAEIVVDWRSRLAGVRGDATALALLDRLPAAPVLDVASAASLSGRSIAAANNAVRRLVDAGILVPSKAHRRNRTFEASAILDAFVALERRLASPAGDTYLAKPARAVPLRPKR